MDEFTFDNALQADPLAKSYHLDRPKIEEVDYRKIARWHASKLCKDRWGITTEKPITELALYEKSLPQEFVTNILTELGMFVSRPSLVIASSAPNLVYMSLEDYLKISGPKNVRKQTSMRMMVEKGNYDSALRVLDSRIMHYARNLQENSDRTGLPITRNVYAVVKGHSELYDVVTASHLQILKLLDNKDKLFSQFLE